MHGYQLRKQLTAMLGPLWQVSWGSLYPTLRRLAKTGAVEATNERRPRKTSKGSRNTLAAGRRRTVYRITQEGEALFSQMLEESVEIVDTDNFSLKLAFFRYMRPEKRLAVLERRRAHLQEKLAQFRTNLRTYKEGIDAYALSLQSHDMATTESDIAWIDELIDKEDELIDKETGQSTRRARDRSRTSDVRVRQDA